MWSPDGGEIAFFVDGKLKRVPASGGQALAICDAPGLFTAVQEELGLKFESTNAPVDVLVIDRAEKPSEN